jgi:crotonobetainyl-CoA:carnitine CoA-transferase CaiB-like acyl-CoA transferase
MLTGFRVVQVGPGLAAAVCGRLFADVGAEVVRVAPDASTLLGEYLNRGPVVDRVPADADLIAADRA